MDGNLQQYAQRWNLSHARLIAQTPTSHVYAVMRGSERVVLKLLTPTGTEDESDGAIALHYFAGHGAVRLLEHDQQAHLLEYAGDEELAAMVVRGDDTQATEILVTLLNQLHRPQPGVPIPPLRTLRRRFQSLFKRAAQDEAAGKESVYVRGAQVAEHLLANPQHECVLHGDIQHHNIRRHPVRGWLAYDPKGLYGERTYDTANALCNPSTARDQALSEERFLRMSQALASGLNIDVGRLRAFAFAHACLSASWADKPEGSDVQHWFLTVAHNAEKHVNFSALGC